MFNEEVCIPAFSFGSCGRGIERLAGHGGRKRGILYGWLWNDRLARLQFLHSCAMPIGLAWRRRVMFRKSRIRISSAARPNDAVIMLQWRGGLERVIGGGARIG
ncbi:MAG: hypothetical protein WAV72_11200 [Bradyrhizobium sp.]